jgi:hypothetical protein
VRWHRSSCQNDEKRSATAIDISARELHTLKKDMSLFKRLKLILQPSPSSPKVELERQLAELQEELDVYKAATWYGNTVPTWANRDGVANWKAAREAYTGPIHAATHEEFVKIGHIMRDETLFAPDLIQRLSAAFDNAIADPAKAENPFFTSEKLLKAYSDAPLPGPVPDCRRDLHDAARELPMWKELFTEQYVAWIRSCLGSNFTINSVHAARNSHCPPEFIQVFEPFSDRWHWDDQHSDTVFIFIYLKEVTFEHGPFHIHSIENSRRILQLGYDKTKRRVSIGCGLDPAVYENPPSTKLVGPAGSSIITMNSLCLHRAGCPDFDRSRDLLYIKLRPAKELNLIPDGNRSAMMFAA